MQQAKILKVSTYLAKRTCITALTIEIFSAALVDDFSLVRTRRIARARVTHALTQTDTRHNYVITSTPKTRIPALDGPENRNSTHKVRSAAPEMFLFVCYTQKHRTKPKPTNFVNQPLTRNLKPIVNQT